MKHLFILMTALLALPFSATASDDHCFTLDESFSFTFSPFRTPFGMRTYVHGEENFFVYVKPFCAPTEDLSYALVSYVNRDYLQAKFPTQQIGESMRGTISMCMGNSCFKDKPMICVGSFIQEYMKRCQ